MVLSLSIVTNIFSLSLLTMQVQSFPGYPQLEEPQLRVSLEAYILWLMGKVMFTENHVTTIAARYIPIAREIAMATGPEDIRQRSWGSAVLAATYRGMCNACQLTETKSAILGCPLFLQLWSWERFSIGRPAIDFGPFSITEIDDGDLIDKPTFTTLYTRRLVCLGYILITVGHVTLTQTNLCFFVQRRYSPSQTKQCYKAFTEQFDVYTAVIWQPYTPEEINRRYPDGISILCERDQAYWMTKSKIIFDVFVEEMSQPRVMRQFGLRQMVDPPPTDQPLPAIIHGYVYYLHKFVHIRPY